MRHRRRHQMIFVNLPVADLARTRDFYTQLGYGFDDSFCDGNALCLEVGPNIFAMLLQREFYAGFHTKQVVDATVASGCLLAVSAGSRVEVDSHVDRAIAAGGAEVRTEDLGYMYGRSFDDPDGNTWEVIWMDPRAVDGAESGAESHTPEPAGARA